MPQNFYKEITLTLANTNYRLYDLMALIDPNVARSFMYLRLAAPASNTNNVALGANSMVAMGDGDEIFPTGSRLFEASGGLNAISATDKYVRSDAADQTLLIQAICH